MLNLSYSIAHFLDSLFSFPLYALSCPSPLHRAEATAISQNEIESQTAESPVSEATTAEPEAEEVTDPKVEPESTAAEPESSAAEPETTAEPESAAEPEGSTEESIPEAESEETVEETTRADEPLAKHAQPEAESEPEIDGGGIYRRQTDVCSSTKHPHILPLLSSYIYFPSVCGYFHIFLPQVLIT